MASWLEKMAVCALGAGLLVAPVATATAQSTEYLIGQVRKAAPSCRQHPDYPIQGRVSGNREVDGRSEAISFVGCFPTQAECEAWRVKASSFVTGLIIYNSCGPRK
ncbi:hypothetical protein [Amorphus sp. 3PC139-8]|uniref:hypothetical protein n=1 Tax=Amorphus sp. 3PC139-8 TaxID=2735676 RepID=UPI00345CCA8D